MFHYFLQNCQGIAVGESSVRNRKQRDGEKIIAAAVKHEQRKRREEVGSVPLWKIGSIALCKKGIQWDAPSTPPTPHVGSLVKFGIYN